jgi:hypothetical protein
MWSDVENAMMHDRAILGVTLALLVAQFFEDHPPFDLGKTKQSIVYLRLVHAPSKATARSIEEPSASKETGYC